MKNLCIVVSVATFIESFMLENLKHLSQNFNLTIISSDSINFGKNPQFYCQTKHINIARKINFFHDIKAIYLLFRYFKNQHFDLVLSFTPKAGLLGIIAAFLAGIQLRIHCFTGQVWANKSFIFRNFLKFFDKIVVYFASDILVDGKAQWEFLLQEKIITRVNSHYISLVGIDFTKFKPNADVRRSLLEKYHLSSKRLIFMFLGRINKDKGILDLIAVMKKISVKHKHLVLFLVGSDEEGIIKQYRKNLMAKNIIKINHTKSPELILNIADVLVLPSYREGSSVVVLQAAAMKIPSIASDIYGVKNMVINNETGLLHQVRNIDDMAEVYAKLIHTPSLIKLLGDSAYDFVRKHFNTHQTAQIFTQFFTALVALKK